MRKATQRQFVQKLLDAMFATIKHSNQVEREVGMHVLTCTATYTYIQVHTCVCNKVCTMPEHRSIFGQFIFIAL